MFPTNDITIFQYLPDIGDENVNDFLMTKSLDDVIADRRGSVKPKDELLIATG